MASTEDINLIQEKIKILQRKVNGYDTKQNFFTRLFNIKITRNHIYMGIPIAAFILLLFFKPDIVTKEYTGEDGIIQKRYDSSKVVLWTLIFGGSFNLALFAYFYKNKK